MISPSAYPSPWVYGVVASLNPQVSAIHLSLQLRAKDLLLARIDRDYENFLDTNPGRERKDRHLRLGLQNKVSQRMA